MKKEKLGARFWFSIVLIGMIGQLAWAIENNYINLWVYSQTGNSDAITWMTISSALMATLTTFFIGALSDKLGKRRLFISIGYIVWGISVVIFGTLSYKNMLSLSGEQNTAIMLVGLFMVLADNFMTFFGSSANDAAFNAWVTDNTNEDNRGKVESFLSIMPLFANVVMMVIGMPLHIGSVPDDYLKEQIANGVYANSQDALAHGWFYYFLICGLLVVIVGIISIFLLPKDNIKPNRETKYGQELIYGFRPSVVKNNKELYMVLLTFLCFNSAINAFMPYYLIYFQNDASYGGLGFGSGIQFYIAFAIILIVSSVLTILVGLFLMNRIDRFKIFYGGLALAFLGAIGLFFVTNLQWAIVILATLLITGYLICTAVLGAYVRDKTPENHVGSFQGVRMVFAVLIPMVTGPLISQALFPYTEYSDPTSASLGGKTPSKVMFMVAAAFLLVALIPMVVLNVWNKKKSDETDTTSQPEQK